MKIFKSCWMWLIASLITTAVGWDGWAALFFFFFLAHFAISNYSWVEKFQGNRVIMNTGYATFNDIVNAQKEGGGDLPIVVQGNSNSKYVVGRVLHNTEIASTPVILLSELTTLKVVSK